MKIKSLYVASNAVAAGKLVVTMGMMEFLKAKMGRVAFFKPFVVDDTRDDDITFFLERYSLVMDRKEMFGFTVEQIERYAAEGRLNVALKVLMRRIKMLEAAYDFVLIEGLQQGAFSSTIEMDINLELARNSRAAYVSVLQGYSKSVREVMDEILIDSEHITASGCVHFATFANRLDKGIAEPLRAKLDQHAFPMPIYLLEEIPELDMPTVGEVQRTLGCERLWGKEEEIRRVVRGTRIAAMRLEHFLEYLEAGDLILVPGDRPDIVVGALMAAGSPHYPTISGILLTGGHPLPQAVVTMLEGADHQGIPILTFEEDTYQTALKVERVAATIGVASERKIALAMGLFNGAVDYDHLRRKIAQATSSVMTPMMFEYSLFQKAQADKKRIVLPEATDERVLRACEVLLRRDAVEIILLGKAEEIGRIADAKGLDIARATIVDPETSSLVEPFVETFFALRRSKGITPDAALDMVMSPSYFGTMMVHMGYADGMVSGAIHTTQETIRPALQIIKTQPGVPIVSSLFFMSMARQVLIYADCAINQDPDPEALATIAISTADTAAQFGFEPRVAMLSYSTGGSGKGADVDKVVQAARIAQERRPDLLLEGPMQYDAAIDPEVARSKLPDSEVAGKATVFIFPDLNTGNNTYKAVQRSTGALAVGPILQGLNKPINDLSRGCTASDIISTVLITAIQASEGSGS
jgi:phosphate acetyltransferase